jgi:hypothetical protein
LAYKATADFKTDGRDSVLCADDLFECYHRVGLPQLECASKNIGHFVAKLLLGFFELRIILSKHVDSTYKTVSVLY